MLSFASYDRLTLTAVSDVSEDKNAHGKVGCLGTLTVDLNCSTVLGCIDTSRKGCQLTAHVYVFGCSHAHLMHLDRPTTNLWSLQLCRLTLQCEWHARRGFVKSVHCLGYSQHFAVFWLAVQFQ